MVPATISGLYSLSIHFQANRNLLKISIYSTFPISSFFSFELHYEFDDVIIDKSVLPWHVKSVAFILNILARCEDLWKAQPLH